jgi:ubiquinone/menaquinone biosynthesis C-methylase UbiE
MEKLICPKCKKNIENLNLNYKCDSCNLDFKFEDGILRFSKATIKDSQKEDVYEFWNTAPNESLSSKSELNTKEFFEESEKYRYQSIHKNLGIPFFKKAIQFEKYKNLKILEIGCGIGVDSIQFARAGNHMTLLDLTFESLKITKKRLENENLTAKYIEGDAENLPFASDSFDMVYSYGVIHHSPNTEVSVKEIFRVLKPGGQAIVMLYSKYSAMVYSNLLINEGIRQGYLFKYKSLQKVINHRTELQSAKEGNDPVLTRVFSKNAIRKMFSDFDKLTISTEYLTEGMLAQMRYLLIFVPKKLQSKLHRWLGWNHIIVAKKR